MNKSRRRTVVMVAGATSVLAGGGLAFAYWTSTGSGSGQATTGSSESIVVNQTSTITGLAPGLPAQTLSGTFDNPNDGPVFVTAVSATVTGTDKPGCTAADYTLAGSAPVNREIAAGDGVEGWSGLTIQFNNKPTVNQDACKDAVVNIAYTAS